MAAYSGTSFTTVSVYTDTSIGTLSAIFDDNAMTEPKANPFPCFGSYTFYAAAGQYVVQGNLTQIVNQPPVAFANLPFAPSQGDVRTITDSSTAVWGDVIAGGGANEVLAWFNGTDWTVIGK